MLVAVFELPSLDFFSFLKGLCLCFVVFHKYVLPLSQGNQMGTLLLALIKQTVM